MADLLGIGSLIGAGTGLLGSLFGGGGISGKEQRNNFRWAVNELDAFNEQFQNSPELANLMAAIGRYGQDPMTYSPEFVASQKARLAEDAVGGAKAATGQAWERAGAKGAYRDSSTRAAERNIGLRQGAMIAQGNRDVDAQARSTRAADLSQFGAILSALTNMRMQPLLAETSARLGAPVTQQGNPFGNLLEGIGTISTALGTARQSGGGTAWGNLMGGGGASGGQNAQGMSALLRALGLN